MGKSEHYKNNPNDKPLGPLEKKLMRKVNQLQHHRKVSSIKSNIVILLLHSQIKADSNIKNTFAEMYPNEYKAALAYSVLKNGPTQKKEVRREEIIKSMNLKDRNILRENYGK